MHLTIERRTAEDPAAGDQAIDLVVSGRFDAESAPDLEATVAEELHRGHHAIRLDFLGVSFISSAGIRVLFDVHRAAKSAGGSCLIGAASEPVTRVLELTKLASILMEQAGGRQGVPGVRTVPAPGTPPAAAVPPDQVRLGGILFGGVVPAGGDGVRGVLVGSAAAVRGTATAAVPRRVPRQACGLGIAAIADDVGWERIAGEMVAACGTVFHRPPQPFAAIDYLIGAEQLVPVVQMASGLVWEGVPRGRAGFETADGETAVRFDDLAERILELAGAECVALVVVAEVQGLIGVELIRPLAEATPQDHPGAGTAAIATRWLNFAREPVHARHTALVVGVATRAAPAGPLAEFVRPFGAGSVHGHAHAVVFPLRPLKRGAGDLAAAVDDLSASAPLAVMHLLGDPQPVLGSGQSELVRGGCWFAPLTIDTEGWR